MLGQHRRRRASVFTGLLSQCVVKCLLVESLCLFTKSFESSILEIYRDVLSLEITELKIDYVSYSEM